MAPSEKSSSKNEVCLTIDHPQKVMMMGKAKDLGRCQSRTKAGNFCTNVVNKRTGEYCSYHVQAAYRKTSSKRPALQAGFNAPVPRSFEQKLFNAGQEVFYGGQSFSSESFRRQKKSEKVTLSSMNKHKKPGTMSLVKLQPEDEEKLKDLVSTKKEAFQDMLQRPTVGAINFMKHLQGAEKIEKEKKQKDQPMASVTFTDFLKEAKQVMARNRKGAKLPQAAGSSSQASGVTPAPSTARPQLGRGFAPGTDIFLESPTKNKKSQDSIWGTGTEESRERSSLPGVASNLKSISRKQAAAKLKKNIEQQDPNRVKKRVSPEAQQRIKKRLLETTEEKENPSELTPPSKKPRILGGLDIDSEEVQKLLKEGSSHKGAVDDVITEAEEKYFKALECKESMEEKMSKITQVLCSVVSCKVCKYTAQKPADRCKQLGHDLLRTKALKQFFKCCDCGNRCIAFDKYPKRSCKKCGGSRYERTSMLAERKGVKLDSEKLLLRGEEQKFLNSLN
ncbi:protein MCM10 homolog [Lineus longissimus]|uniref:protein MCM10 homolog n=1 Tax=Lineus longissimus TaxID=88925 RepID=UPI00315C9C2D